MCNSARVCVCVRVCVRACERACARVPVAPENVVRGVELEGFCKVDGRVFPLLLLEGAVAPRLFLLRRLDVCYQLVLGEIRAVPRVPQRLQLREQHGSLLCIPPHLRLYALAARCLCIHKALEQALGLRLARIAFAPRRRELNAVLRVRERFGVAPHGLLRVACRAVGVQDVVFGRLRMCVRARLRVSAAGGTLPVGGLAAPQDARGRVARQKGGEGEGQGRLTMSMAAEYSSTASAKRPSPNSVLPFALCSSAVWTSAASMLAAGVVMDVVTAGLRVARVAAAAES